MDADESDETKKAFASIQAALAGFSSPPPSQPTNYTLTATEWLQQELNDDTPMLPAQTPKRTPLLERAGTPVMSNSSRNLTELLDAEDEPKPMQTPHQPVQTPKPLSSGGRSKYSLSDSDSEDSDLENELRRGGDEPLPVQTPLQRRFKTARVPTPPSAESLTTRRPSGTLVRRSSFRSTPPTAQAVALKPSVFRRHHDALWDYLEAKEGLWRRMDLAKQQQALEREEARRAAGSSTISTTGSHGLSLVTTASDDSMDMSSSAAEYLALEERQTEVDFCKTLGHIGYGIGTMLDGLMAASANPKPKDDHEILEEGHVWELLASLRKLGGSALVWDDDATSATQNASAQSFFLQQLTTQVNATPKELVDVLEQSAENPSSGSPSSAASRLPTNLPLVLQRKRALLHWIRSCLEKESRDDKAALPSSKTTKIPSKTHPDDPSIPSLVSEMEASVQKQLAKVCLALVLEGKPHEAAQQARSFEQYSKAAAWSGGTPPGYATKADHATQTLQPNVPVGNPSRFLWKRQVWKTGRKLLLKHQTMATQSHWQQQQSYYSQPYQQQPKQHGFEDAAIYSILSDDVQNALDNPCIRSSWTRSLGVLLSGVQGRLVDEVLCKHNSYRRRSNQCFPGYQYESHENEQLLNTSGLATTTEAQIAQKLHNSHFLRQQEVQKQQQNSKRSRRFPYRQAMLAFCVGKSHVLEFCARETSRVVTDLEEASHTGGIDDGDDAYLQQDWEGVRFLTHLTLFLDSLQLSSTPVVCDNITEQKNAVLFQYVQYLESRPDLWHFLALYVKFLPEDTTLEYYPTVLARVLDEDERRRMTDQIRALMPALELPLLRQVVRRVLAAPSTASGLNCTAEEMDTLRCRSIRWLLQRDEHLEDALICANILLREFFTDTRDDKTGAAAAFLSDSLPESFLELVALASQQREEAMEYLVEGSSESSESALFAARVNNAVSEHMAYISYLEAYGTFERWKETLQATPTSLDDDYLPSYANLNETERSVADSNRLRTWINEKKKHLETTLLAAEEARTAWHNVLVHPGGWLSVEDEDLPGTLDEEEQKRRADICTIRSRHLVLAANLYHQVCEETAAWLSKSLLEAEGFSLSKEEVLQRLQSNMFRGVSAAAVAKNHHNAQHQPAYWYQHALDLAVLVASDKHGIHKAFPPADLREFITKLGETAVSKLMNV